MGLVVILWQRPARIALGTFAVAFAVIVSFGARDRTPSVVAETVARTDRTAIIESREAQIVQREKRSDNLKIQADRQLGYEDGSVKLLGNVAIEFADGLLVAAEEAVYENGGDVVTIPGQTSFGRPNMKATAGAARYERNEDLLYLEPNAEVVLTVTDEADAVSETSISAERALVAQADGYMEFLGGVEILGGSQLMGANEIRTNLDPLSSEIESLVLTGDARVTGTERIVGTLEAVTAEEIGVTYLEKALDAIALEGDSRLALFTDGSVGQLREMSATDVLVAYQGGSLNTIVLERDANISLIGKEDGPGTAIAGEHIEIALDSGVGGFEHISANENVAIQLPSSGGGLQTASADSLEVLNEDGADGLEARFSGGVEYYESVAEETEVEKETFRRIVSENLTAQLDRELTGIDAATFTGEVAVETADLTGSAEQVVYDVATDQVDFSGTDEQGQGPLVNDTRGALLATAINVQLNGPDVKATGSVSSVLSSGPSAPDASSGNKRPSLLSGDAPIYVNSSEFSYSAATATATYTGAARLWQDLTEFRGNSLVLHESTGDVTANGAVETQMPLVQNIEGNDEPIESVATGRAGSFEYIDSTRTVTYASAATFVTEAIDLSAGTITLSLEQDGRSLGRILATGEVKLALEGRQMSGETMTYYESDGRYEMMGDPVRIVEELTVAVEESDPDSVECRETTGRALTFYVTSQALTVDAQSEVRTTSMNQPCPALP